MKRVKADIALALTALALIATAAGCGGSSSSSTGSSDGTTSSGGKASNQVAFAEFGKSEITEAGTEAGEEEREAASEVLSENLEARASGDFAGQCETLAANVVKAIEKGATTLPPSNACASLLEGEAKKAPKYVLANTLSGPIVVLLLEGANKGTALYHGNDGNDYAMPMIKEGGEWKVGALLTISLGEPESESKGGSAEPKPSAPEPEVETKSG